MNLDSLSLETRPSSNISLESMLYEPYYRKYGVRRKGQLDNPPIQSMSMVMLPKYSIYHYNSDNSTDLGPSEKNPWYHLDDRIRYIDHVTEYVQPTQGIVIRKQVPVLQIIEKYRQQHRSLKKLRNFASVDQMVNTLIIENYNVLNFVYRYQPHRYSNYYRFVNHYGTVINRMNELGKTSTRQQFMEIRLPKRVLSRLQYNVLAKEYIRGLNSKLVKTFKNNDSWLFFHLWLWLSDKREYSIFNKLSPLLFDKMNFIIEESGYYTLINLGMLNSWRKEEQETIQDHEDVLVEDEEGNASAENTHLLTVRFYRLVQKLLDYRVNQGSVDDIEENFNQDIDVSDVTVTDEEENEEPDLKPKTHYPEGILNEATNEKNQITKKALPDSQVKTTNKTSQLPDTTVRTDTKPSDHVIEDEIVPSKLLEEQRKQDEQEVRGMEGHENPHLAVPSQDAKQLLNEGQITIREYNRIIRLAESFTKQPSPYDEKQTVEEFLKIPEEDINQINRIQVKDNPWITDKSMLEVTTEAMDKQYLEKVYHKNVIQAVMSLQKAGIMVSDIRREEFKDVSSHYEILTFKVTPIGGTTSTVNLKLPVLDEEGVFESQGTKYFVRKQRFDKPIRKVTPSHVALSSFYGKLNIKKLENKAYNAKQYYMQEIQNGLKAERITDETYADVNRKDTLLPIDYSFIASRYAAFTAHNQELNDSIKLCFNYDHRFDNLNANEQQHALEEERRNNAIFIGVSEKTKQRYYMSIKDNSTYCELNPVYRPLWELCGFPKRPPTELAILRLMGTNVPIVMMLGYYLGISRLCRVLNVKPRKVLRGSRSDLSSFEFDVKFADETWIFDKRNAVAALVFGGFNQYAKHLNQYSVQLFEKPDVYSTILNAVGLSYKVETEFKFLKRLFIDDVTKDILKFMKEPTEWIPLIIRAVELLTTNESKDEINMDDMLIRGNQRIAGHIYRELVRAAKYHSRGSANTRTRFDVPVHTVFNSILSDPTTTIVDDVNPIQNIKEHDNVTFGGSDGRSTRSMVAHTRAYHKSDLGRISEATVDNQNVAVTAFLSGNPTLTSVYGDSADNFAEKGATSILSVSALLAPGATQDDAKRALFLSVQNSHTISIAGSVPSPVRTGYEYVIPYRVSKKFVRLAKQDGKVIEKSKTHMALEYQDGKIERFKIGKFYGVSAGSMVNGDMFTDYEAGMTFKQNDCIAFNPTHFVRDIFNPGQVIYKNAALVRTVLMESNDTEEDSSAISPRVASALETKTIEKRTLVIPFNNEIIDLINVGELVTNESILCKLSSSGISDSKHLSASELRALAELAQTAPKAKYTGQIAKIEVRYYSAERDIEQTDISESVLAIINKAEKEAKKQSKLTGGDVPPSRRVMESVRIGHQPVPNNSLILDFYIENYDRNTIGDKVVFSLQLKSVVTRVMSGRNETESGKPIDAIFGYQSISNRIVSSAELNGTANILLKAITQEVIDIYRNKIPRK